MKCLRPAARLLRRGFTLIELLAVILIISILAVALLPMVTDAVDSAGVTGCSTNMQNIYKTVVIYKQKYKRLPNKSGVQFFADLYARRAMEQTKANAERLKCPNVDVGALTIGSLPWEEWWDPIDDVDGSYSSYAGRNCAEHPLRKLTGTEPLMADDNDPEMNHNTTTNVLYADGSVVGFELVTLEEEGILMKDEILYVGIESPVEDLRKLSLD